MSEVITAIISAGVTLLVCLINNYFQVQKQKSEFKEHVSRIEAMQNQTLAVMEFKIEALTKAVEKHNSVVERTFELEGDVGLLKERIAVANQRIDDIERGVS